MSKAIIFSIIFMTIAIPMRLSTAPNPKKALTLSYRLWIAFNFIYVLLLVYLVPRVL